MSNERKCPVMHGHHLPHAGSSHANRRWWPQQVNLALLHQHTPASDPMDRDFDYAKAFESLDYAALKHDLHVLMTDSQAWWPADYGHYGPLFIRMAWHSAGTYRTADGRGGARTGSHRFAPLNSWPDNGNLDKARRLLWPIKKKYGASISWADLMILAGNVALESMGFQTIGFAGGRQDIWAPEEDIDWGPETEWLGDARHRPERALANPLAAVQMGLIYVNPEGPNGEPDPVASGRDVRETFARMAMNDEETVALIAGGHTFGKAHGAGDASQVGPEPAGAALEEQGLGWFNAQGRGFAGDTITSGIEGAWKPHPTRWDNGYLDMLFGYEWELVKSPAGAWQWQAKNVADEHLIVDAHDPSKRHPPIMTTADLSLRFDPVFEPIARRFHADPSAFEQAFARAWFKLTHRDMGPRSRYLGPEVPSETWLWQDLVPPADSKPINEQDVERLKQRITASGLPIGQRVSAAWAAASTFRSTDLRGGANGGRLRLSPQRDWAANQPQQLAEVLQVLDTIKRDFDRNHHNKKRVSIADLLVLAGASAIEEAARNAGHDVRVGFLPGRTDAGADATDIASIDVLQPQADGFRNYQAPTSRTPAEHLLIDKAQQLSLSAPEMVVLVGGMRVLGANTDASPHGVLTDRPGSLTPDFFENLLDMNVRWQAVDGAEDVFEGTDRASGKPRWTATRADLVLGSHAQLRAIAEVYGSSDAKGKFVRDFVAAWEKVMNLDRFDTA